MDLELLKNKASICDLCDLSNGRIKPVFDKGNSSSSIMICGMVPASEENKIGLPFVGRAGKLLDRVLELTGLSIDNVYITNLVKCYLAAGLLLQQTWIDNCLPFLLTQISIINPKVILSLGKDASCTLLGLDKSISLGKIRGEIYEYGIGISVLPTYHPSYLLRGGGESHKDFDKVIHDFNLAVEISKV
jgi:uracil-DNA glycosylase family 4